MRAFIVSLLILALMLTVGITSDMYLKRVAENIGEYTADVAKAAFDEDYEKMTQTYTELNNYWKKNEMPLAAVLDHAHIGEINKSLSEIEMGIEAKESIEVLLADARIKTTIKTISDNEHFHMKNIL